MAAGFLLDTEKCAKQGERIQPCLSVGSFEKIQAIVKIVVTCHTLVLTLMKLAFPGERPR